MAHEADRHRMACLPCEVGVSNNRGTEKLPDSKHPLQATSCKSFQNGLLCWAFWPWPCPQAHSPY